MLNRQHLPLFASVIALHVLALWALQNGLLQRVIDEASEVLVMAQVLAPAPQAPAPRAPEQPAVKPAAPSKPLASPLPPANLARVEPKQASPEPTANTPLAPVPTGTNNANVAPPQSAGLASPVATPAQVAQAAPPAAKVELPSSDAQYLQNPKPAYPALSRRMNEHGKVVIRVLIGVEGQAQKAEIFQSSGFDRLDQAALKTVLGWRYVPGKRAGIPEAMWFNVPINFVLE